MTATAWRRTRRALRRDRPQRDTGRRRAGDRGRPASRRVAGAGAGRSRCGDRSPAALRRHQGGSSGHRAPGGGHGACARRIDLEPHLPFEVRRSLAALAPPSIVVPSGRSKTLEYGEDGSVSASVKLQELFGLAETPTVGPRHVPILFHLLAPNGGPCRRRAICGASGDDIPRSAKGAARPLSQAPLAGRPWTAQATHKTKKR